MPKPTITILRTEKEQAGPALLTKFMQMPPEDQRQFQADLMAFGVAGIFTPPDGAPRIATTLEIINAEKSHGKTKAA